MGSTILMNVALEVTKNYYPWESGQVVVGLSRNEYAHKLWIVTDKGNDWAIERLWATLCISSQWTALTDDIVNRLSVSGLENNNTRREERNILNVTDTFPWRPKDYQLPTSRVSCVYMIVSTSVPNFIDVGQTSRGIRERVEEHQRMRGNQFTNYHAYLPFAVAAFITKIDGLDQSARQSLERHWQMLNKQSMSSGNGDIQTCMDNGDVVVTEHNEKVKDPSKHIQLIKLLQRKAN